MSVKLDEFIEALKDCPMTTKELAEYLDKPVPNVYGIIKYYSESFRIASWVRERTHLTRVWGVANGQPDAAKPRKLTPRERAARYRKPRLKLLSAKASKHPQSPWAAFL